MIEAVETWVEAPSALAIWTAGNLEIGPALRLRPLTGGQSNPTFELIAAGGQCVLRRKPLGRLLPSAHAIEREHRALSALWPTGYPVPRPGAYCDDPSILGAPFYVMDFVEGETHWDPVMPALTPADRRAAYAAQIEALAWLHNLDPQRIGLGDFGRPADYFMRQLSRWSRQYAAGTGARLPAMERLARALAAEAPPTGRSALVHGDFRLHNLLFAPPGDRIAAVLDWELATLGDPLADLGHVLMTWFLPVGPARGLQGAAPAAMEGVPSAEEMAALYCELTQRVEIERLDWCMAYSFFRLAAISDGIAERYRAGAEVDARAVSAAEAVPRFAAIAERFLNGSVAGWSAAQGDFR